MVEGCVAIGHCTALDGCVFACVCCVRVVPVGCRIVKLSKRHNLQCWANKYAMFDTRSIQACQLVQQVLIQIVYLMELMPVGILAC